MRAVIERAPLLAAMGRLMGVVERRQIIPILANVCLTVSRGQVQLRGTDLDMEIIETIPANVDEPGEITVSAEKLHDIVRNADGQVTISTSPKDPRALVQSGRSRFNLPTIDPADFPTFKADGLSEPWTIKASLLADMVSRVAFARGDVNRGAQGGIFLGVSGEELHAVACFSAGMALRREPAPAGASIAHILLPKFTNHLVRWLADVEDDALVSHTDSLVRIECGSATLTGKVLDGPYLNYMNALGDTHEAAAMTDQDALAAAMKRVMIMGDSKAGTIRLAIEDNGLALDARSAEAGDGADEIACDYDGPAASVLMNFDRLIAAIANLSGDRVELGFSPQLNPQVALSGKVIVRNPGDPGMVVNLMQPRA